MLFERGSAPCPLHPAPAERFKALGSAYAALSDTTKRKLYDEHGAEGLELADMPPDEMMRMFQGEPLLSHCVCVGFTAANRPAKALR